MKGFLINALILASLSAFTTTAVYANKPNMKSKKQMWMCETNASSSSNAMDAKADEDMKKGGKKAMSAFEFALKHCRDCTKITCTMESPSASDTSTTTDMSTKPSTNTSTSPSY